MLRSGIIAIALVAVVLSTNTAARASDQSGLHIELNNLQTSDKGCRLVFVMRNAMKTAISQLALEVVLFDDQSRVSRIVALEAGGLPVSKTRVKQFNIAGKPCTGISRVLLNAINTCSGEGLDAKVCLAQLKTASRVSQKFGY